MPPLSTSLTELRRMVEILREAIEAVTLPLAGWSLTIFCARATRGLRRMRRAAWSSSCSRNAHDQNVLVRRAQSRIDQATLQNEMGN